MSRVTEIAEREAAAAEAEPEPTEPTEPEPTKPEPEPEPEPETMGDVQAAEDAQVKALRKHMEAHGRKLRTILGDVFDAFEPCTYCEGIGYREQSAPKQHPHARMCDECGGHGFRFTGSNNPAYGTLDCEACMGQGYRMEATPLPTPQPPAQPVVYIDAATGLPAVPQPQQPPLPANGAWAPGFQPQPQPMPQPVPQP